MLQIHKLDLLVAVYIFCVVTSELMGAKTVPLGSVLGWNFNASVALLTVPLVFTINDVITEVYGKERTRSIIRAGLVVVALTMFYSLLATHLPASTRFAPTEGAYDTIFGLSARFSFASLMAFAIAEFTDVYVFVKIRKALGERALWLRNNVSNFVAQFIDTVIFMTLAFWSFEQGTSENLAFIVSIFVPYLLMKWAISVLETPFVYLGVRWLKSDQGARS